MIGQKISHYEILEQLGEGGMGIVYKARDLALNRMVALKFLPDRASTAPEETARFIQEAQAAAALNHPNICTIYGIEEFDGTHFIAMEFVDGRTLQSKKTSLSPKQAIDIGIQIAEGIAAAHEQGIVHRDIKPENIMLRKDGSVVVMDFGVARLRGASRLTKEGSTVGTVGYMSPEQVQGFDADHRSDLFSLGVILYELLAGRSPFRGVHAAAITYEIVHVGPPPLSAIMPGIDPELERLILECLVKDPRERSQSAAELARHLRHLKRDADITRSRQIPVAMPVPQPGGEAASDRGFRFAFPWRAPHWIVLAGSCGIVALLTAAAGRYLSPESPKEVRKFVSPTDCFDNVLSPDGKKIAYSKGKTIWIRRFTSLEPAMIEARDIVSRIIWAPNSEDIAYLTAGSETWRVALSDFHQSLVVKTQSNYYPRCWGQDDSLIVSTWDNRGLNTLLKVASSGGPLVAAFGGDSLHATIRGDLTHVLELPDGKSLLLSVNESLAINGKERSKIFVQCDGQRKEIYSTATRNDIGEPVYSNSGHILFPLVGSGLGAGEDIWAIPFDASRLETTGEPFLVAQKAGGISVSSNGMISYFTRSSERTGEELVLVSRSGKVLDVVSQSSVDISAPAISPEGSFAATMQRKTDYRQTWEIWIHDLQKKTSTQLSFDIPNATFPAWAPSGKEIAFSAGTLDRMALYIQPTDGISSPRLLLPKGYFAGSPRYSPDGKYLFFVNRELDKGEADLWFVERARTDAPRPLFESRFSEASPCPSPDGRYLAYQSGKSGQEEIYVTTIPAADHHWQVTFNGGTWPQWEGNEIFFATPRVNDVMAARVSTHRGFKAELPQRLFSADSAGINISGWGTYKFAVTRDGKRIIASRGLAGNSKPHLVIVENWFEEFRIRKQ
jgi:eukaryotic-like serine/threonine-protein kinase